MDTKDKTDPKMEFYMAATLSRPFIANYSVSHTPPQGHILNPLSFHVWAEPRVDAISKDVFYTY